MQFKRLILFLAFLAPTLVSAQLQTSPRGLRYQILERKNTVGRPRGLSQGDYLTLHMYTANHKDSIVNKQNLEDVVLDASTSPIDVRDVLPFLFPGDSVVCLVPVDTFARYTGRSMPAFFPKGTDMKHFIRVVKAESPLEQQAKDAQIIQEYAKANNLKTQVTPSGLHYVITQVGKGTKPTKGEKVTVHYRGLLLDGKEFDASYTRNQPFSFTLGIGQVIKGWDESVALLPLGSKATILVPSGLGYGKRGAGGAIPPNAVLRFDIEVLDVPSEKRVIEDYAKANNLKLSSTPTGLQYVITQVGTGAVPKRGQTVIVHYKGTLLNGTEFDSSYSRNTPFEFTLGMGQVIRGWDEGIALMPIGSKATLLIPSELGYGSRGAGGSIPPDTILRFDVELIGVR